MNRLFFSLLFCLITVCSYAQQEIPLTVLPSGHVQVKASVDGVEGNFILDTGAGLTVFTKTFFDKLRHAKLQDGGYTAFRATGERVDVDLYTVPDMVLGSLKKAEETASYLDFNLGGLDGILSLKLLETQPFTMDFDRQVLRFETPRQLAALRKTGTVVPLQIEQSRGRALDIFAFFSVNDTLTLQLALDSGAGKDVYKFNAKYMQRLGIDATDTVKVKRRAKKSEINPAFVSHTYYAPVKKLAAAEGAAVSVSGIPAQFVDGLIYDGIIWINWMGSKITINIPAAEMLVQRK